MNETIRRSDYRHRASKRRRQRFFHRLPLILIILLLFILLTVFCWLLGRHFLGKDSPPTMSSPIPSSTGEEPVRTESSTELEISTDPEPTMDPMVDELLDDADRIAAGYDYDRAIALLQDSKFYGSNSAVDEAIAEYEQIKSTLKPYDITQITHVFFHTLVMDESKAFDGDSDESGYNQVMTTKDEFLKILDAMYEKGYVLVRLHDMAG